MRIRRAVVELACLAWFTISAGVASPYLVRDIRPDATAGDANPAAFASIGTTTLFVGCDPFHGCELWKTDGSAAGTVLVQDIASGSLGSDPLELTPVGGLLLLVGVFLTAYGPPPSKGSG